MTHFRLAFFAFVFIFLFSKPALAHAARPIISRADSSPPSLSKSRKVDEQVSESTADYPMSSGPSRKGSGH
ncbi:hypothetical protein M5689_012788 [Euphorbia peplus]|nr:hypothetical protein M5689_012788 [Euphorbia peplus]